ncbi:Alcohol dehydrogenase, zinc-binding domain protein [Leifsonia rubra CMS 76R]|nr:Alcohol dehydrogenase, zinc-binding domain protein [Leifsonia rubra CMS 76R]
MKAIVQRAYGNADVLKLEEIDRPVIGDDEVLVRVVAAGLNHADWVYTSGTPLIARLAFGISAPKAIVRGKDVAGVVEAIGANVTTFRPGDEVYGELESGTFAEHVAAPALLLARKPATLTFEQAATVPLSGMTALLGLRDAGSVAPGQRVLINGASGGVGTFAVQIAKALGAEVTAVNSARNGELTRSLGADHVIDYAQEDFTLGTTRYDVIFDLVGDHSLTELRDALTPMGTLVLERHRWADSRTDGAHPQGGRNFALRQPEAQPVHSKRDQNITRPTARPDRSRSGHPGDRSHLPSRRGSCRNALLRRRTRPRKDRDHHLTSVADRRSNCTTPPKGKQLMTMTTSESPRKMNAGHMLALVAGVLLGAGFPVVLAFSLPPLLAVGLVIAGIVLIIVGAAGLGRSIQSAVPTTTTVGNPIRLEGTLDPKLSRWMWLIKCLLAIPHFVMLIVLWVAFVIVTIAAGFAILFTGRYPASLFEFSTGVLRWNWRVAFYANGVLGSDTYPPFTLARTDYPATFEVAYPSTLSRWKVLFKSWLFALPQLVIIAVATGATWDAWNGGAANGVSLLGLLLLVAAIILLFSGVYRLGLFNLIMGAHRWMYRVFSYTALMCDEYPPFRLDQGATERGRSLQWN